MINPNSAIRSLFFTLLLFHSSWPLQTAQSSELEVTHLNCLVDTDVDYRGASIMAMEAV